MKIKTKCIKEHILSVKEILKEAGFEGDIRDIRLETTYESVEASKVQIDTMNFGPRKIEDYKLIVEME